MPKAIFLDRDGTINEDPGYLNDPSQLRLLPLVGEALSLLRNAGFHLIVVSNQSGVARGLIEKNRLPLIHAKLDELLLPWSVKIDRYMLCIHHPKEECECRKPKPKLILEAALELGIDLSKSFMVGDRGSDILVGHAAGCKGSALVRTGSGKETETQPEGKSASFVGDSLLQVAQWIIDFS